MHCSFLLAVLLVPFVLRGDDRDPLPSVDVNVQRENVLDLRI